jgi:hypothetical protein
MLAGGPIKLKLVMSFIGSFEVKGNFPLVSSTREPEIRPAGVEFQLYSDWTGVQFALQFDRFNFSDESLVVVSQERTDHVEHGVTEATDVHNVSSLASLNRLVRLQIDVDQLRSCFLTCQLALVGNKGFPSRHHTG